MRSNKPTRPQIEAISMRKAILRAVIKAGVCGIRMAALMVMTGRSTTNVGEKLRALAAEEKIECSNSGGNNCVWGPPGTWAHHQKQRDRTAHTRQLQRDRRAEIAAERDEAAAFAEMPIVRRLVPASTALPIPKRGPASVWESAAW